MRRLSFDRPLAPRRSEIPSLPSIRELREAVQGPVRENNDLLWYLGASQVSVYITRLFIWLHLSADAATYLMLASGLLGSMLLPWGDGMAAVGFGLLSLHYVFDVVDGELARHRGQERLTWAFYEYLFHILIKTVFFFCLGWAAFRTARGVWVLVPAYTGLAAHLFVRFLDDLPLTLTARNVLLKTPEAQARILPQIFPGGSEAWEPGARSERGKGGVSHFGGGLSLFRTSVTSFEFSLIYFSLAAVLDLFFSPAEVFGGSLDFKVALLCVYGVILPLDACDRLLTILRRGELLPRARELLIQSHRFRLAGSSDPRRPSPVRDPGR